MGWACLLDRREAKHEETARLMAEWGQSRQGNVGLSHALTQGMEGLLRRVHLRRQ